MDIHILDFMIWMFSLIVIGLTVETYYTPRYAYLAMLLFTIVYGVTFIFFLDMVDVFAWVGRNINIVP